MSVYALKSMMKRREASRVRYKSMTSARADKGCVRQGRRGYISAVHPRSGRELTVVAREFASHDTVKEGYDLISDLFTC